MHQPKMVVLILLAATTLLMANWVSSMRFTALKIDNHPCNAENLKRATRYICDQVGNVICQNGWRQPDRMTDWDRLNPCLVPVCEWQNMTCVNGECRGPNWCACHIGWEGSFCEECIPLPGCRHGFCLNALECRCLPGWEGALCDKAMCDRCEYGECVLPNVCSCLDGWRGPGCGECVELPGCLHGHCRDQPHTCVCEPGWQGPLCDTPICEPPCIHGICQSGNQGNPNFCLCDLGYRGPRCGDCRPYWNCPNQEEDACRQPNECLCRGHEPDPKRLCGNPSLLNLNLSPSHLRQSGSK